MKRLLLAVCICALLGFSAGAQQNYADVPASKEDVQRYLDVMHSKEMMTKMVDAMSVPMHQMIHEQYLKDKDKLPADFEQRMNRTMDDTFKTFPWDELLQSMVPVYQKHLTKGDVDALVAFYSTPTGQKLLQEMPAITAEAMQNMMPLLQKSLQTMQDRMKQQITAMIQESEKKTGTSQSQTNN